MTTTRPYCAVFTPTCRYGGFDVNHASLIRQDYGGPLEWIVGDDLHDERPNVFADYCDIPYVHFLPRAKKPGNWRNLAAAYNDAMRLAKEMKADIFVSMQDYMSLPEGALDRLVDTVLTTNAPVTGLTSLTFDPYPSEVVDPKGLWTIFGFPYRGIPTEINWHDVRQYQISGPGIWEIPYVPFETNWAAWPVEVYSKGVRFDEKFDEHVAYENQDFALQCEAKGYKLFLETRSHALGLPHKAYWPEQEAADAPHCAPNEAYLNQKWGKE